MAKLFLSILASLLFIIIVNCNEKSQKMSTVEQPESSFEYGYANNLQKIYVAYTNDPDSMWSQKGWVKEIKRKMVNQSLKFNTVLLFSSIENTPNVALEGMSYSQEFDRFLVCGYWRYPNGRTKFCYGGVKQDGNFFHCE